MNYMFLTPLPSWFYAFWFFVNPHFKKLLSLSSSQVNQLFLEFMWFSAGIILYLFLIHKVAFSPYVTRIIFLYSGSRLFGQGHWGIAGYMFRLSNWWVKDNYHLLSFCKGACEWGFWQWWDRGPLPCSWKTSVLYGF